MKFSNFNYKMSGYGFTLLIGFIFLFVLRDFSFVPRVYFIIQFMFAIYCVGKYQFFEINTKRNDFSFPSVIRYTLYITGFFINASIPPFILTSIFRNLLPGGEAISLMTFVIFFAWIINILILLFFSWLTPKATAFSSINSSEVNE